MCLYLHILDGRKHHYEWDGVAKSEESEWPAKERKNGDNSPDSPLPVGCTLRTCS